MSIFFDEDKTLTPDSNTSVAKGERTNFMENASSAFTAFRRSELFTSERNNLEEEYINIVNILQKAGHTDIVSPLTEQVTFDNSARSIFDNEITGVNNQSK